MNKKKLLYVVEAMGGGVFTYIVDLANELINTFDIYIAYAVRPQTPTDYTSYFDNRIHLIEVKSLNRSLDFIKDIKAFFEIRKIADEIQPDIIHLHSSKAGVLGRWAFNGRKNPVFYTPHGYSFLMANQSNRRRMIYRIIEATSAKLYCTTISCSEGEHRETINLTKRATYVNNGVNVEKLQILIDSIQAKADIESNHNFRVFTLGRICDQKNPGLFNKIAEAMPNVQFLWIGDGELRDQLTSPNIEITGWVEREVALEKSLSADVFLLTSLWEGLPMSLLEAMYMKKLCIVSNVIGNSDVIQTGINGFVCETLEDFIEAIKIAQTLYPKELINRAYYDITHKYNTISMVESYKKIYDAAIAKNDTV